MARDSQLNVLWMSGRSYQPMQTIAHHKHQFYQAQYVVSGQIDLTLAQEHYKLVPGNWVLICPETAHEYTFSKQAQIIDWKFKIDATLTAIISPIFKYPVIKIGDNAITTNITYMLQLIQKSEWDKLLDATILSLIDSMTKTILLQLVQLVSTQNGFTNSLINHSTIPDEVKPVITYIEQHLADSLTLDELAAHFPYSKAYLNQLFRRTLQVTPNQFIQQARLQYGKQLLEHTDQTIEAIANTVGLNNNYFSKLLLKYEHQTPREYRRTVRLSHRQNVILSDDFDITTQPQS